jgi:hypothetical protein
MQIVCIFLGDQKALTALRHEPHLTLWGVVPCQGMAPQIL